MLEKLFDVTNMKLQIVNLLTNFLSQDPNFARTFAKLIPYVNIICLFAH